MKARTIVILIAAVFMFSGAAFAEKPAVVSQFSDAELLALGQKVYEIKGQQTCFKCHQEGGIGEGFAGAADLRKPYKWKTFQLLGGYDALKADPAGFKADMSEALKYLLANGGIKMNSKFKKDHPDLHGKMDWSLVDAKKKQFDMMMWGTAQPEMKRKMKPIQKELEAAGKTIGKKEMGVLATYAVFEYIKGFEEPNKEDPSLPLILKDAE